VRVVIYCRAAEEGLAEQATALAAEAKRRGWEVTGVFAEKGEGSVGLHAALAVMQEGRADLLLVSFLDDLVTRLDPLDMSGVPVASLGELQEMGRLVAVDGRGGGRRRRGRRLRLVR
jgi:DNA invertase Pin-like site-specific DNA recombinase